MKATELKIGDWVAYKGKPAKIHALDSPCIYVDADGEIWGTLEDDGDISPIPLTDKILEENGWQWDKRNYDWRLKNLAVAPYDIAGKEHLAVYVHNDPDIVNICDDICHVHELQHILWALGLDDNLKI